MYQVNEAACTGCGDCLETCPAGAIALVDSRAHIDQAACTECGSCAAACPQGAITMVASRAPAPSTVVEPQLPAVIPSQIEAAGRAHRVEILLPPPERPRNRFWPIVGSGIVWAARELLPALLQAWQETSGLAGGRPATGRRLAGRGGASAGRRRMRWRHGENGAVRSRLGGGTPKGNRC